jgi:hypothetical protein
MKKGHNDFFWPSYVDLMTGLFIVMLVLFVLSYKLLSDSKKVSEQKLKKIEEVQNAVSGLPRDYFTYENEYKRYLLTRQISFAKGKSEIPLIDEIYLNDVGTSLRLMIDSLQIKFAADSIKYILIIEGMASNDSYTQNYQLSYERALSVYYFWLKKKIRFNPEICETMISGSGTGGVGRDTIKETNNQRIIIQIIPKLSKFLESNLLRPTDNSSTFGSNEKRNIKPVITSSKTSLRPKQKIKYPLTILCYPSGAKIILEGKNIGTAPYRGMQYPNNYLLEIHAPGYKEITCEIKVDSAKTNDYDFNLESILDDGKN